MDEITLNYDFRVKAGFALILAKSVAESKLIQKYSSWECRDEKTSRLPCCSWVVWFEIGVEYKDFLIFPLLQKRVF